MFELFKEESFVFDPEWTLNCSDLAIKVLIMVSSEQNSQKKYVGTLKDMCAWMGSKNSSYANRNLKAAIEELTEKGYVTYSRRGNYWIIELILSSSLKPFYFRYCWLEKIRTFNKDESGKRIDPKVSVDWIQMVKVFVYVLAYIPNDEITKQYVRAAEINMSSETFGIAFKALNQIGLDDIGLHKRKRYVVTEFDKDDQPIAWKPIGSSFNSGLEW